jgi:hypothetical protein
MKRDDVGENIAGDPQLGEHRNDSVLVPVAALNGETGGAARREDD